MKKGYVVNEKPDLIPANFDLIYVVGMVGKERDPLCMQKWDNIPPEKRGLIHRPALAVDVNEYDNASAFKWLLDDLGYSNWNNGNPLIVDIWEASGDTRFNLDHIRVYGGYVTEYFKPKVKPLLRLNVATWNSYLQNNRTEALRLLTNWDFLLLQPGVTKPDALSDYGMPAWWEYQWDMIAYDNTRAWTTSPAPVIVPVPEPEPEPPIEIPVTITGIPKKWKISLFGGLISGTIEAEE